MSETVHFSDVAAPADDVSSLGAKADIAIGAPRFDFDPRVRPLRRGGWGVVKSLGDLSSGPVGLVNTQKIEAQSEKPTWTKALEFTQFACPCGTDPRLLL
jgi:hypothetical protein